MINWFGPESWDAPICRDCPRCDTPVGDLCGRCARAIRTLDRGVTMPFLGRIGDPRAVMAFHLDCHLKSVLPHRTWALHNLVPDESDGVVNGRFACATCGVTWTTDEGWRG